MPRLMTCLTYSSGAEQAAAFYVSIFPQSSVGRITYYPETGPEEARRVMTVEFELLGRRYAALNGGSHFSFTDGISLAVECETQGEIDHYWEKLSEGGEPGACGWLKDRFGVSWQVTPRLLAQMLGDPEPEKVRRVTEALLKMGKLEIHGLRRAYGDG